MFDDLKNIIDKTVGSIQIEKKLKEHRVFLMWKQILGGKIANASKPVSIRERVLFVKTLSPVWACELNNLKHEIIKKINAALKEDFIYDIKFSYGQFERNKENPVSKKIKPVNTKDFSDELLDMIKNAINMIADSDLREKAFHLILKSLSLQTQRKNSGWKECSRCSILTDKNNLCHSCIREKILEKNAQINSLLIKMPWISYSEILNDFPDISKEEFMAVKNKLSDSLNDEIFKNCIFDNYTLPEKILNNKILTFAMLKTGLPVSKLTDNVLNELLNRTFSKTVRKKLPF